MDNFPFTILLAVFILVAIQYLMEAHAGISTSMFDAESGLSTGYMPRKSPPCQLLGRMIPLQLTAIGLPLFAYDLLSGFLLIMIALLFAACANRNCP